MNEEKEHLIEALSRYLPKRIVEKIKLDPNRTHIEGERRKATILFMDVSGFTAISENLDCEEVVETINDFFSRMHSIIEKYGGEIDKFMGDAMLVLWGTPVAYEDDDERACFAAIEMMQEIQNFNAYRPDEVRKKFPISMTLGINSGLVFAGNVGSDKRMEYTVMGDNVNLAARLESMANPGEIVISGETASNLSEKILLRSLGKVPVKGKTEPVDVYVIGGLKEEIGELIDRSEFYFERPLLEKKFLNIKEQGGIIQITGTAGCGKTEIIKKNSDRALYFEISSFNKNIPFGFIKALLRHFLGISSFDKNEIVRSLQEYIKSHRELLNEFPVMLDLFDIKHAFQGEEKKWKVFELTANILKGLREDVIIENFDNADQLSADFFKYFFNTQNIDTRYILSSRTKTLEEYPCLEIPLLEEKEAMMYILRYFKKNYVPDELAKEIFRVSSGNFRLINGALSYLEKQDLIFLKEDGVYLKVPVRSLKLPQKYTNIIISIFDSFDEYTKKFLQNASLIGDVFDIDFLNRVINYKQGRIEGVLRKLIEERIVQKEDEKKYRFLDPAFRETIYEMILRSERAKTHRRIAEICEAISMDSFTIAHHYVRSDNSKLAVQYAKTVSKEALNNFDNLTAIEFAEKGLSFLKSNIYSDNVFNLLDFTMKAYFNLSYYQQGLEMAGRIENILKKTNKEEFLFDIKNTICAYNIDLRNLVRAQKGLDELLKNGVKKFPNIHKNVMINLALIQRMNGKYEDAVSILKEALLMAEEKDLPEPEKISYNIAQNYNLMGNIQEAEKYFLRAYEKASEKKKFSVLCASTTNLGIICMQKGDMQKANDYFDRALKIAQEKYMKYWEAVNLEKIAILNKFMGNFEIAVDNFEKAIYISKAIGDPEILANLYYNSGDVKKNLNRLIEAKSDLDKALELSKKYAIKLDINVLIAGLYKKMGLSKHYLDFVNKCRKEDNDEYLAGLFTLHHYIAKIELKQEINKSILSEISELSKKPYWPDLSLVHEFYTAFNSYIDSKNKDDLKSSVSTLISIGDPDLFSFLFPEITDAILISEMDPEILKGILKDNITAVYVDILKGKKPDTEIIKLFSDNGFYQITDKLSKKLDKKQKNGKILSENVIFREL